MRLGKARALDAANDPIIFVQRMMRRAQPHQAAWASARPRRHTTSYESHQHLY